MSGIKVQRSAVALNVTGSNVSKLQVRCSSQPMFVRHSTRDCAKYEVVSQEWCAYLTLRSSTSWLCIDRQAQESVKSDAGRTRPQPVRRFRARAIQGWCPFCCRGFRQALTSGISSSRVVYRGDRRSCRPACVLLPPACMALATVTAPRPKR